MIAATTTPPPLPRRMQVGFAVAVALLVLLAYLPTGPCSFVFDDIPQIAENPTVVGGNLWAAAFSWHTMLANRPFTCVLLTAEYGLFGPDARGFRIVSIALHFANVLLLFGVARRALLAQNLAARFTAARATAIAATLAGLWAVHPLGVDTVAYSVQQSMLLIATSLLLALYCVLRHHAAPGQRRWHRLAVLGLALGMASKEELVAAPILVVLFERAFLLPTWSSLRAHRRFHLALAATWSVLFACIWAGPPSDTVGNRTFAPVSSIEWLQTQAGVVLHYARLSLWPQPLRAVYDWDIQKEPMASLLPGAAVLLLLGATIWAFRRRPWWGWLGALFFLLLAPSSSFLPIVTEVAAERRAYLPMLAALAPLVIVVDCGFAMLARRGFGAGARIGRVALGLAVAVAAIATTRAHVQVFADEATFWTEAWTNSDAASRSVAAATLRSGYGRVLARQGRDDEAFARFTESMQTDAQLDSVRCNYAIALLRRGRTAEAETVLRELVRDRPEFAMALGLLANLLLERYDQDHIASAPEPADARLMEAEQLGRRAVDLGPSVETLNTLALVLCRRERAGEAEQLLRRAIAIAPGALQSYRNLGAAMLFAGKPAEAVGVWRQLLPIVPQDVNLRMNLAAAHLQLGDRAAANAMLDEVLRLQPDHAEAQALRADRPRDGR